MQPLTKTHPSLCEKYGQEKDWFYVNISRKDPDEYDFRLQCCTDKDIKKAEFVDAEAVQEHTLDKEIVEDAMQVFLDRLDLLNETHRDKYKEMANEVFKGILVVK